jgi:hypothetical protein
MPTIRWVGRPEVFCNAHGRRRPLLLSGAVGGELPPAIGYWRHAAVERRSKNRPEASGCALVQLRSYLTKRNRAVRVSAITDASINSLPRRTCESRSDPSAGKDRLQFSGDTNNTNGWVRSSTTERNHVRGSSPARYSDCHCLRGPL